jgi:hypothetical protein
MPQSSRLKCLKRSGDLRPTAVAAQDAQDVYIDRKEKNLKRLGDENKAEKAIHVMMSMIEPCELYKEGVGRTCIGLS